MDSDSTIKCFVELVNTISKQTKMIDDLRVDMEILKKKCELLDELNKEMKQKDAEFKNIKNEMVVVQSDVSKMQEPVDECAKWLDVMTELVNQVQELNRSHEEVSTLKGSLRDTLKEVDRLKRKIDKLELQQRSVPQSLPRPPPQPSAHSYHRTPTHSPSLYSMPTHFRGVDHHRSNLRVPSELRFDIKDELDEATSLAGDVVKVSQEMDHDINRSLSRSSISDH